MKIIRNKNKEWQEYEGYWIINGRKYEFEAGDVLIIEPNDRHAVINDSDKDYVYLAIKYNYEDGNDSYWIK